MPLRALLVLLVMLNFGVATWWLLRPAPRAPAPWTQPADVPRLQLLGERAGGVDAMASTGPADAAGNGGAGGDAGGGDGDVADASGGASATAAAAADDGASPAPGSVAGVVAPPGATQAPPSAPASVPVAGTASATPASPAAAMRCVSFGPFSDAGAVATARAALQPLGAARMRVRDVIDAPRGWRVVMAAQADRAAADALAARIRDAGFDDLLVVPSGDEANSIALGRYGSEPAARRRESALRTAGFPAQAQPLGDASTRHWLDVAAGAGFDAASARTAAGTAQVRDVDCAFAIDAAPSR